MKRILFSLLLMFPLLTWAGDFNYFAKPTGIVKEKSFKVFQTILNDAGLAHGKGDGTFAYLGEIYLVVKPDGNPCFDGDVIKVRRKEVACIIGRFTYETRNGSTKSVPIIKIMMKKEYNKVKGNKR